MKYKPVPFCKNVHSYVLSPEIDICIFQSAGRAHKVDKEKATESEDTGKGMRTVNGMYPCSKHQIGKLTSLLLEVLVFFQICFSSVPS